MPVVIDNVSFLCNVRIQPGSLVFTCDEGAGSSRLYPDDWAGVTWHAVRILNGCYWSCRQVDAEGRYVPSGIMLLVPTSGLVYHVDDPMVNLLRGRTWGRQHRILPRPSVGKQLGLAANKEAHGSDPCASLFATKRRRWNHTAPASHGDNQLPNRKDSLPMARNCPR